VGAVVTAFAINVASVVFVAGAGRLARAALGKQQQLDLKGIFDRASAAMLSELVRGNLDSRELQQH
jgi:hypothetical protein